MSLYNNVAANLKNLTKSGSSSVPTSIGSAISKGIGGVAGAATEALGGGSLAKQVVQGAQGVANNYASGLVNKYLPASTQKIVNVGMTAGASLASGDLQGAGMKVISSGLLGQLFPGAKGVLTQAAYWGTPTPLFGGISPTDAKRIYDEMRGEQLAKRNLWLLEVSSNLSGGAYNIPARFNMFATGLEYSPFVCEGDSVKVGGSSVGLVEGSGAVEMQITTYDDANGSLKRWFALHHAAATARDGTVGEPGKYAIRIRVVHSFIEETSGAYEDIGFFRPENLSVSLSRREDDVSELQMTFVQLDTFMRA